AARPVAMSELSPREGGIVCDRIVFGYGEEAVLHDVSLRVLPGENVALVGRTGAGKTSIVHLLGGLYSPWRGSVQVAGRDPRSITDEERRRIVAVVPQVSQLFSGTVMENLSLKDANVSEAGVIAAARISGADTFIRALPHGYQTRLRGSGRGQGVQLSAGQEELL